MAKKTTKLSVVNKSIPEDEQKRRREENDRWEKAEESWKITRVEVKQRVSVVRDILESLRDQLEGVPFDLPCGDLPRSLDFDRIETVEMVKDLNPVVDGLFKMIDDFADQHGCTDFLDFNAKLFLLKMQIAETGFQIGVLAGVIFAGCSKETIDRFARGLTFATQSNSWMVKG